jgi:hypothetical protein
MTKDLEDRIVEYSDTIARLLSEKADAIARATAAEARVKELDKKLREEENTRLKQVGELAGELSRCRAVLGMMREKERERDGLLRAVTDNHEAHCAAEAAEARATAAEAALDKIVRGRFDGLEVTHYAAIECRNIARAALEARQS